MDGVSVFETLILPLLSPQERIRGANDRSSGFPKYRRNNRFPCPAVDFMWLFVGMACSGASGSRAIRTSELLNLSESSERRVIEVSLIERQSSTTLAEVTLVFVPAGAARHSAEPVSSHNNRSVGSSLQFIPPTGTLGPVRCGTTATLQFSVVNTTTGPLQLAEALPSCVCTDVSLSRDRLMPGESADLKCSVMRAE